MTAVVGIPNISNSSNKTTYVYVVARKRYNDFLEFLKSLKLSKENLDPEYDRGDFKVVTINIEKSHKNYSSVYESISRHDLDFLK